jgi:chorismate dehydratase
MHERSGGKILAEKRDAKPLPRLGQISFINNLPVVLPIQRGLVDLAAETTYANPAELNAAYAKDLLDVGAMSSFFYLQQPDFKLVETVSISCVKEVGSVLFFCRRQPKDLEGATIAVPASSATSTNLLQVLLRERHGVAVNIQVQSKPDLLDERFAGALVIGDHALHVDKLWSRSFERIDLGQWWHHGTGLPMVFGVWAAANNWHDENRDRFNEISCSLGRAAEIGLSELFSEVVLVASERTGLDAATLGHYYKEQLNYEMTPQHHEGLEQYRRLCVKHGLL